MGRWACSVILILLLASSATFTNFASGYEKENHYWMKMAVALNCGFTLDEARLISIGDFSIDADSDTQPVRSGSGQDNPKWKWHALPTDNPDVGKDETSSGNQQIKQRQHELYDRALNEKDTGMRLFKFGQYLHYQEDKWSHWGYTTGIGHAVPNVTPGMTSPDETHASPEFYRYMVFDSMVNLGKLAKSLGKTTECVSDLVPLDTYHSAPEYGKDFPWFSPQELKRTDALKFQKTVDRHLADWKKTSLINEVIDVSEKQGDEGVTNSFIAYIANKTGISKSDVAKKYDFANVDIDENGNAKSLPDELTKPIKTTKISDNKKSTKNDKLQISKEDIKLLYRTAKEYELAASSLLAVNDDQDKVIKSITANGWTKSKDPKIIPHAKVIEIFKKQQEVDKKNIQQILSGIKDISNKIKEQAKKQGVSASELDKTVSTIKKNGKSGSPTPTSRLKDDAVDAKTLQDTADKDKEKLSQSPGEISRILAAELDDKPLIEKFRIHGIVTKDEAASLLRDHEKELTYSEKIDLQNIVNGIYGEHSIYHIDPNGATWIPNDPTDLLSDEQRTKYILDLMDQAIDLLRQEEDQQTNSILKQIEEPSLKDMFANPDNPPQTPPKSTQSTPQSSQSAQHTATQIRPANDKPKTETGTGSQIRIQSRHGSTETSDSTITNSKRHDLLGTWVIAPQRGKEYHTAVIRITNPDGTTTDVNANIVDGVIQLRQQIYNIGKYTLNIISIDGNAVPANNGIEITVSRDQVRDSVPQTPPNVPSTSTIPSIPSTPVKTNTKPTISMPAQITQEATGPSGAQVVIQVVASDKEDGPILPVCNPAPGYTYPIGTTTVTCSATDSDGNTVIGTSTVTVVDTQGPVISPITPQEGARDDSGVVISYLVTAIDVVDGPVVPKCNYPSGYKFPIGTTILTCTAVDSKGHQTSRSLQITVTLKQTGQ